MSLTRYQPHNLLVTGGAGFIGANFIRYMLKECPWVSILNLDLLTYAGSLTNLAHLPDPKRHVFMQGDIGDPHLVPMLLKKYAIDTIVHFAAESHVDRSIEGPAPFIHTNVVGTFNLLEAARNYWLNEQGWDNKHCRFHHISTDEVFGALQKQDPPFTETTPYAPNSPYSASKAASDHLVRAYYHTYGLPITVSNCSNNYGPYQHGEKLIPTIIRSCLNRLPIPIYGDGSNIRDWLYVTDHCRGIHAILERGQIGESYNLGGHHEVDNLTLAYQICALMDQHYPKDEPYHHLIQFVTDRKGHDWRYAIDTKKVMLELNWRPEESFQSGLRKTLAYYMPAVEDVCL